MPSGSSSHGAARLTLFFIYICAHISPSVPLPFRDFNRPSLIVSTVAAEFVQVEYISVTLLLKLNEGGFLFELDDVAGMSTMQRCSLHSGWPGNGMFKYHFTEGSFLQGTPFDLVDE